MAKSSIGAQLILGKPPVFQGDVHAYLRDHSNFMAQAVQKIESWSKVITQPTANAYATSNVTTDRTIDADSTSTAEIADVLCTVIEDLRTKGILA